MMKKISLDNVLLVSGASRNAESKVILYPPVSDIFLPESITQNLRFHPPILRNTVILFLIVVALIFVGLFNEEVTKLLKKYTISILEMVLFAFSTLVKIFKDVLKHL